MQRTTDNISETNPILSKTQNRLWAFKVSAEEGVYSPCNNMGHLFPKFTPKHKFDLSKPVVNGTFDIKFYEFCRKSCTAPLKRKIILIQTLM